MSGEDFEPLPTIFAEGETEDSDGSGGQFGSLLLRVFQSQTERVTRFGAGLRTDTRRWFPPRAAPTTLPAAIIGNIQEEEIEFASEEVGQTEEIVEMMSTNKYAARFARTTAVTINELRAEQTVVSRANRGAKGSKERLKTQKAATEALETKFGVPKHFVSNVNGESETGNIQSERLSEIIVSSARKTKKLKERCADYDLSSALLIPVVVDGNATMPCNRWGGQERDLLENFGSISLEECMAWTKDTLQHGGDEDQADQTWLLQLMRNSCTEEILTRIDANFEELEPAYKGGTVFIKLMFNVIIDLTDSVVESLQKFLKNFGYKGLMGIQGENVGVAELEIVAVATRLSEVNKLQDDAVNQVLD